MNISASCATNGHRLKVGGAPMTPASIGPAATSRYLLGFAVILLVQMSAPAHSGPMRTFNLRNSFPMRMTMPHDLSARLPRTGKPKEIVVVGSEIKDATASGGASKSTGVFKIYDNNISEILANNGNVNFDGGNRVQAGDVLIHRWQR
jgi:hypothetical protein